MEIKEYAPAAEGSVDAWEACLRQITDADIVPMVYNGNAGWAKNAGQVNIRHAELERRLSTGRPRCG